MLKEPTCSIRRCIYFIGAKQDTDKGEASERVVCAAFPNGIPDDIAYGDNLHLKPVAGDKGITFEEAESS